MPASTLLGGKPQDKRTRARQGTSETGNSRVLVCQSPFAGSRVEPSGPRNPARKAESPSRLAPPRTDHGNCQTVVTLSNLNGRSPTHTITCSPTVGRHRPPAGSYRLPEAVPRRSHEKSDAALVEKIP